MHAIAVINQKGGCGKTTVAINLSACLAYQGKRTLLIDMDPQSHCAVGLAVPEDQIEHNIYDVLIAQHSGSDIQLKNIVWQIAQNFDLAPSGIELAALEQQLAGKDKREDCLLDVLERDGHAYDCIVIDCPPSVGLLTFNALRAANEILIPVETGYFALHGLGRQLETLRVLQEQCQKGVSFRVLASMYDVRTKLAREVLSELKKHHRASMCKTVINFNTKLKEAASFGQPITEYDSASKGMQDFVSLAKELTGRADSAAAEAKKSVQAVAKQMEAISLQAKEVLAESKEMIGENAASAAQAQATLEEKIDRFYGVRQQHDSLLFSALYPEADKVQLAGDFNDWQPENTTLQSEQDGQWRVELPLESGTYRYRYVVDGVWQQDPYNDACEVNPFGELNSVVHVQ